jgi:hypothetical protein
MLDPGWSFKIDAEEKDDRLWRLLVHSAVDPEAGTEERTIAGERLKDKPRQLGDL